MNDRQIHLSELIEQCDPEIDATSTSDLTADSMSQLLWLMTRQKPSTSLSSLRVYNYVDLGALLRLKYNKLLRLPEIADSMTLIKTQPCLDNAYIHQVARSQGFDPDWLHHPKRPGKSGGRPSKAGYRR